MNVLALSVLAATLLAFGHHAEVHAGTEGCLDVWPVAPRNPYVGIPCQGRPSVAACVDHACTEARP